MGGVDKLETAVLNHEGTQVLLALGGIMGRSITSKWLQKNGVDIKEACTWNELTKSLQEISEFKCLLRSSLTGCSGFEDVNGQQISGPTFVIVIDVVLLDLNTTIWKEQLSVLDKFHTQAEIAWLLDHDTSNIVKMELRRRGYLLMVNKPVYKAKMIQILESIVKARKVKMQNSLDTFKASMVGNIHESLESDINHSDAASSNDSARYMNEETNLERASHSGGNEKETLQKARSLQNGTHCNRSFELTQVTIKKNECITNGDPRRPKEWLNSASSTEIQGTTCSNEVVNEKNCLKGVRILLVEDTPVLQRVATIMLEKMGAEVVVVEDGLQAVDALKVTSQPNSICEGMSPAKDSCSTTFPTAKSCGSPPYDLILMDCQMPKMDGYEATRAIREAEMGSDKHIPIVALTAHAMSSDEAKCLKVGMDAYLTKPIDRKLMVSTILSLTKRTA